MACSNDMMDVAHTQVVEEASNPLIVHASLDTYKLSVSQSMVLSMQQLVVN